jgi:glycosyl hydrolase family 39 (putative alpha-L-iduronidase)
MTEKWFRVTRNVMLVLMILFAGVIVKYGVLDNLGREAELFVVEKEVYAPADIVVNVIEVEGVLDAPWTAFAQGGEEMYKNMLSGTEGMMKQLKPSYIRLDHIFDDDYYGVVSREGGQLRANFSKLDEVVRSMQAMGAKPFFSLGYMPSEIAPNKIAKPRDWGEWSWLVSQTIAHYSGKNGMNIANAYYEVWNEPDLESFGYWKYHGNKSYLDMYWHSAAAAKALRNRADIQEFKFGGPAITALYRNWVLALVNMTRENNLPLDFISWHRYDYADWIYGEDMEDLKYWLGDAFDDYEYVISEWGPDPGKTEVYSGYLAGAHAVAAMRSCIYDVHWAFAFEVKDGPEQENFGWGLFSHETAGMKYKPRYKAFEMMSDMSGNKVTLSGEGSNVVGWAVVNGDLVSIILTNYRYSDVMTEQVPISVIGLKSSTNYIVRWEKMSGDKKRVVVGSGFEGAIEQKFSLNTNDVLKIEIEELGKEQNQFVD